MTMRRIRPSAIVGGAVLGMVTLAALAAPHVAPHESDVQHRDHVFAPPMPLRLIDAQGQWRAPFVYPLRLADRVSRRYEEDRTRPIVIEWFAGGKLLRPAEAAGEPLFLLGTDSLGRDVFARLAAGGRASLGVAVMAALGALVLGALLGGIAGHAGGTLDEAIMRLSEFVLVLPAIYTVLALRAVLPLVLPAPVLFALMAGLLALVGWPYVARGVRAIVVAERQRDYAAAATALGAGPARVLIRHLLPATTGFLVAQSTLLIPAFILAEATLSYVGLGFAEPTPSWGSMLQEAANIRALADFPWLLAPAALIVAVVLAVNLVARAPGRLDGLTLMAALDSPRPGAKLRSGRSNLSP